MSATVPGLRSSASEPCARNPLHWVAVLIGIGLAIRVKQGTDVSFYGISFRFLGIPHVGKWGRLRGPQASESLLYARSSFVPSSGRIQQDHAHRSLRSSSRPRSGHQSSSGTTVNSVFKTYTASSHCGPCLKDGPNGPLGVSACGCCFWSCDRA